MDNEGCGSSHCARLSCGTGIDKGAWLFVSGNLIEREEERKRVRRGGERGVARVTCEHSQGPVGGDRDRDLGYILQLSETPPQPQLLKRPRHAPCAEYEPVLLTVRRRRYPPLRNHNRYRYSHCSASHNPRIIQQRNAMYYNGLASANARR